jgi:dTDP-4-dehydrorhamnose 3,5-epimerase
MIFQATDIHGLRAVILQRHADERGSFARSFCGNEFAAHGLPATFVQASVSVTRHAHTLRGMHHQLAPHEETKLVRCVRGAIYDVVADLRPDSPSYMTWQAFRLDQDGDLSLCIPPGCAHGFQTLTDDTEVTYLMSTEHAPAFAAGFRYDDPAFAIAWPHEPSVIADKDLAWPPYMPERRGSRGGGRITNCCTPGS